MTEKFYKAKAGKNGWSEWFQPVMDGFRMKCCDCGLVHRFQFNTLVVTQRGRGRGFDAQVLPKVPFRVEFRVRRSR